MSTIAELNAATDEALKDRATEAAKAPAPPAPRPRRAPAKAPAAKAAPAKAPAAKAAPAKAAPKSAPKKPAPAPVPSGRRALTPKERAARPVTATIAAYVEYLNREVYGGRLTKEQKSIAGISITLYGAYQISPERRAARGL